MSLTGFLTKEERDIFNILQSVSGIGVKLALLILDEFSIAELIDIMIREDFKELSRAKGVGAKVAQKIILELKDKLILTSRKHIFKQNYQTAKIYILADKMHIKRIISNLLTNAVNHSKENTTIRLESQIKDDYFTFKVTSEGAPLSEDALKCLFDKDKIFNLKADGLSTGLGLYLSNSLLKLNRGEFFYNSSIEGKNSFGFKINLGNKNKQNKGKLIKISLQN